MVQVDVDVSFLFNVYIVKQIVVSILLKVKKSSFIYTEKCGYFFDKEYSYNGHNNTKWNKQYQCVHRFLILFFRFHLSVYFYFSLSPLTLYFFFFCSTHYSLLFNFNLFVSFFFYSRSSLERYLIFHRSFLTSIIIIFLLIVVFVVGFVVCVYHHKYLRFKNHWHINNIHLSVFSGPTFYLRAASLLSFSLSLPCFSIHSAVSITAHLHIRYSVCGQQQ